MAITPFNQQVILITGAAQRIGAAIARHLHHHGARVILHYRHSVSAAQQLAAELNAHRSDSATIVTADLSQIEQIEPLIGEAAAMWQRLDGLVNNASTFYPTAIGNASLAQWDELINSNLRAPFFLCQAALPWLQQHGGAIVNIVDIHGERPLRGYPIYSISKAGLIMLTQSLAREMAPAIRVNGVAPGAILWPEAAATLDSHKQQQILDRIPLQRQGHPDDIARAVLYLLRDADYTNGQILAVDGGRTTTQ
jgi:pteridine reductase